MNKPIPGKWQIIQSESEFQSLENEWEQLFRSNPMHNPFQSWSWTNDWLRHLAGPHQLHVICLRGDKQQLQLVVPLVWSNRNGSHRGQRLNLICSYGQDCSDHLGALRQPSLDSDAPRLVAEAIAAGSGSMDRIELESVGNSGLFAESLAKRLLLFRKNTKLQPYEVCPTAVLPESWDNFLQSLSSNFRSQVRRHRKRIDNSDVAEFKTVDANDAAEFAEALIRLNRSRMGEKGTVSSLENPAFRSLLVDAIPKLAQAGLAWMDTVVAEGKVVGAALNLVHGKSVYYYMGGFDDAAKNLRPGTALFAVIIERAITRGYTQYDFLRGDEAYKYRWGATDSPTYSIAVYPDGFLRGAFAYRLDECVGWARDQVRRALKPK